MSDTSIYTYGDDEEARDELARLRALAGVKQALWELANNILDVARGTGKPVLLGPQAQALIDNIDAHRSLTGSVPSNAELADVLDIAAIPTVLDSLQTAATGLASYRAQTRPEAEPRIPNGYNTGYRPETQTTDY